MSELTVTQRATKHLGWIRESRNRLHCFVAVDEAAVLRDAARLDAIPPAERGPLHGVTLGVKDIIDVAGLPTRAGSSFFRRDPTVDAPVVAALRAAGALVLGKTNTHEFAWGVTTENPHFGRTANPRDERRIAGGSSGGSAAAVSAQLCEIALGTDTLGSIRIPAALNGISGVRPATGALPIDGIFPLAIGLDTVGPMARAVATVQRAYEVLAGEPVRSVTVRRACRLRGGVWDRVDPKVSAALDAATDTLRSAGVVVDDVTWWDDALVRAVATVQQRAAARVHAPLYAAHREEYGADVRARVEFALGVGEAEEAEARETIGFARSTWTAALDGYEVAIALSAGREAPIAPAPASFRDETIPFVTPASAFGLPVVAVPIGYGPEVMPLGMQLIALGGDVAPAFALAAAYQELTAWHVLLPPN